jgi:hypothetical protein
MALPGEDKPGRHGRPRIGGLTHPPSVPMIVYMRTPPIRRRRLLAPLSLLLAAAALAPAAMAAGLTDQLQSTVSQTVTDPPGPLGQVVGQAQGAVDQVQTSLGPAQGPTQGPVDSAQSTVGTATHTGPSGSPSGSPSPSNTAPTARTSRTTSSSPPRARSGAPSRTSRGTRVSRRTAGTGIAAAVVAARTATTRLAAALIAPGGTGGGAAKPQTGGDSGGGGIGGPVARTFTRLVKVVPTPIKALIGFLGLLAALFALRSWLHGRRARRLERQREELLGDVGLLQRALLPDVPARIGALETSVGYRPAEGPAAGGDFYDVFQIEGGRIAIIVGDVCGHGRQALAQTALIRYTLRAYIDAGLGPRGALQVAGRAIANDLAGELTTVVVAVYDPDDASLTYACAGHEPPILLGPPAHEPVVGGAAPPVGAGVETGMRETRVPLPAGSTACFFTDGLVEARVEGGLLGRKRLKEMLAGLGEWDSAKDLLVRLAETTQRATDDMAACIVRAVEGTPTSNARVEQLEVRAGEDWTRPARSFLAGAGIADQGRVEQLLHAARLRAAEFGAAILRVTVENGVTKAEVVEPDDRGVTVLPPLQSGEAPDTIAL